MLQHLTDNPLQLYWFRKDPHIDANKEIFEEGGIENVEIFCNRESGLGYATLYFSDGSGWILRNDDSRLQIFPDGHIELGMNWPHRTIKIDSNAISLGDGEHPAAAARGMETPGTEAQQRRFEAVFAACTVPHEGRKHEVIAISDEK